MSKAVASVQWLVASQNPAQVRLTTVTGHWTR